MLVAPCEITNDSDNQSNFESNKTMTTKMLIASFENLDNQ